MRGGAERAQHGDLAATLDDRERERAGHDEQRDGAGDPSHGAEDGDECRLGRRRGDHRRRRGTRASRSRTSRGAARPAVAEVAAPASRRARGGALTAAGGRRSARGRGAVAWRAARRSAASSRYRDRVDQPRRAGEAGGGASAKNSVGGPAGPRTGPVTRKVASPAGRRDAHARSRRPAARRRRPRAGRRLATRREAVGRERGARPRVGAQLPSRRAGDASTRRRERDVPDAALEAGDRRGVEPGHGPRRVGGSGAQDGVGGRRSGPGRARSARRPSAGRCRRRA